jgi:ABC-2 type transport system permease protein
MNERVKRMVIKEFIQVLRDKKMRGIVFVVPIIQLLAFGYAVTMDVNHVATAVYDLDNSQESRELVRRLESSGYFKIDYYPRSPRELRELLDRGKAVCAVQIDPGFSSDVKKGHSAAVQVILDGTDSNSAMVVMSYVTRILATYAQERAGPQIRAVTAPVRVETRVWYNPDLRSRNYNVPGSGRSAPLSN